MTVDATSRYRHEHGGQEYRFCSARCLEKFRADPNTYVGKQVAHVHEHGHPPVQGQDVQLVGSDAPAGTIYTCPMHPEVRQDHPGNCPKCGMALEPELPNLEDEENPELRDFRRRFWWTLPLTVLVTLLAMLGLCRCVS